MNKLLPFVFLVVAIGLFFGYIRPMWSGDIAAYKTQIASYDSALDAADRFKAKEAELEMQRNQIPPAQLARLDTFLPDSVDNVQLILDLNSLATRSGITLSDFRLGGGVNESSNTSAGGGNSVPVAQAAAGAAPSIDQSGGSFARPQPIDSLTLSVSATGTYNAFRSFLAGIEQSLRPLDVVSLAVDESDTGVYTYEVTLRFYWLH